MLQKFSEITTKEMNRKEFLQNAGIGALVLVGGGLVFKALGVPVGKSKNQSAGYGSSAYGGTK